MPHQNEEGQIVIVLALGALVLAALLMFKGSSYNTTNSQTTIAGSNYCRPDVTADGNFNPSAPSVIAPQFVNTGSNQVNLVPNSSVLYKRVKSNVPIWSASFTGCSCHFLSAGQDTTTGSAQDCAQPFLTQNPGLKCDHAGATDLSIHFQNFPELVTTDVQGKKYQVYFPRGEAANGQADSTFPTEGNSEAHVKFGDLGLIFLAHLQNNASTNFIDIHAPQDQLLADFKRKDYRLLSNNQTPTSQIFNQESFFVVDVYQQAASNNPTTLIPKTPLDPNVLKCQDGGGDTYQLPSDISTQTVVGPSTSSNPSSSNNSNQRQLQLNTFHPEIVSFNQFSSKGWYVPNCKPAIYLYPTIETPVNVKVSTTGFLTYTNPTYDPSVGWNVFAQPGGNIVNGLKNYPYLYYESKVPDSLISTPKQGFVVKMDQLNELFSTLLPQLGLNNKESQEFKDYWNKALPKSPYYFVGVMPQSQIDSLEPLTINPAPQTNIRVRLYFQALNTPPTTPITPPSLATPTRVGFTMVEWGGMVKIDKDHPFTCSM